MSPWPSGHGPAAKTRRKSAPLRHGPAREKLGEGADKPRKVTVEGETACHVLFLCSAAVFLNTSRARADPGREARCEESASRRGRRRLAVGRLFGFRSTRGISRPRLYFFLNTAVAAMRRRMSSASLGAWQQVSLVDPSRWGESTTQGEIHRRTAKNNRE